MRNIIMREVKVVQAGEKHGESLYMGLKYFRQTSQGAEERSTDTTRNQWEGGAAHP